MVKINQRSASGLSGRVYQRIMDQTARAVKNNDMA